MLISLTSFLASLFVALISTNSFWPTNNWYDFYRPVLVFFGSYFICIFVIWWNLLALFGLFVNQKKVYDKPDKWSKFWFIQGVHYINSHARIKMRIKGRDKLPSVPYLLVANHESNFDSMLIADAFKHHDIAFITKPGNFKIPLGNKFMTGLCYMAIQKDDKMQSLQVVKRAISLLESGTTSVGVFPEGTRSKNNEVGPFHEGMFTIALHSKSPIVVVAIKGTKKIHKNFPLKKTIVNIDVVEVINSEDYIDLTAKQVSDQARNLIISHLNQTSL